MQIQVQHRPEQFGGACQVRDILRRCPWLLKARSLHTPCHTSRATCCLRHDLHILRQQEQWHKVLIVRTKGMVQTRRHYARQKRQEARIVHTRHMISLHVETVHPFSSTAMHSTKTVLTNLHSTVAQRSHALSIHACTVVAHMSPRMTA